MKLKKGNKTALIFGATGLIGGHLLRLLLENESYKKVIIFSRRKLDLEHPKLQQEIVDFDQLENYQSLIKGDDLFCTLGTTRKKAGSKKGFYKVDFTYTYKAAAIASKNKINQFLLVSSVGADTESMFFYSQVKGQIEQAIHKLDFWSTHVFRPSLLLGERNENRWGEEIAGVIGKLFDKVTGGMLTKYKPIEAEVVAKAMIKAAQELESGKYLYPSSMLQILSEKEKALTPRN